VDQRAPAEKRIAARDPDHWPSVALALKLDLPVWSQDKNLADDSWHIAPMIPQRLYLKNGVDPARAVETLRTLIVEARNLPSSRPDVAGFRDRYLMWVEGAQLQLDNFTADPAVLSMLQTASHWQIRQLNGDTPRPWPLIRAEVELQERTLTGLADDLERRLVNACNTSAGPAPQRLHRAPGIFTLFAGITCGASRELALTPILRRFVERYSSARK
jgi:hypothetical protein